MRIVIEKAENGFEVEMTDPKIEKANQNAKGGLWRDPMRSFVFTDAKEVVDFIQKNIGKLDADPYGDAFDAAVAETDD